MKRLLGLLGLTCLVVLTASFYLGGYVSLIIAVTSGVLFLLTLFVKRARKNKTIPVILITSFFAASLFLGYTSMYINPLKDTYDHKTVTVRATRISDGYYSGGYYCYKVRCSEVDSQDVNFNMLLRSKDAVWSEICDELLFASELVFGANNIAPSERVFIQTWLPRGHHVEVIKAEHRNLNYSISSLRRSFNRSLYMEMDYDTANFTSAVLLGNRHSLSSEIKGLLRTTGLSHIAVVSGLHLSVMGAIILKLLRRVIRSRYISSSLAIVGVSFFALISGMGVSVVRALVMFIIYTVGTMIGRRSDSLNSIGVAALVLTLSNPYSVGDVGMLLSFAATLGIVLWSGVIYTFIVNKIDKVPVFTRFGVMYKLTKGVVGVFSCNLSATLWTLPISILVFKGFSLVSLLANLFIVPFMSGVLLCMGLCLVTHYVNFLSVLTDTISAVVSFFYDYMITLCKCLASFPFAYINADKPYFVVWVVFTVALVILSYFVRKRFIKVLSILLSIMFLFSASAVYYASRGNILSLHVPYTGSGLSVILESSDGYAVVNMGGSASRCYNVCNTVESLNPTGNNVLVSLSGFNSEVYSENLINEFDYDTVLRYDIGNDSENSGLSDSEIVFSSRHKINLWDKAEVTLIPINKKVFVCIEAGEQRILLVPRYSDCSLLSDEYLSADTVVSQGEVGNPELLSFKTLIVPGDGKYDDESIPMLISDAVTVIRGNNVTYDIDLT